MREVTDNLEQKKSKELVWRENEKGTDTHHKTGNIQDNFPNPQAGV